MSLRLIIVERECGETSDEKISTTIYVRRWSKNKKLVDGWQATTAELESYVIDRSRQRSILMPHVFGESPKRENTMRESIRDEGQKRRGRRRICQQ